MISADDLACYEHLQVLLARDNELTDIKALGNLENLTYIDVSGNKLTNVRTYVPPAAPPAGFSMD